VRDGASDVVVQLALLTSEERIMPILKNATKLLTTQMFKLIRDRVRLALGKDDEKDEEMLVHKLKEEVSDLKSKIKKANPSVKETTKIPKNIVVAIKKEPDGSKSVEIKDTDTKPHVSFAPQSTSTCIFCTSKESFTPLDLDAHYLKSCPMLSPCPLYDSRSNTIDAHQ
jgi:seryl-tRNA synthetase